MYSDLDGDGFLAKPIQLKAASARSFAVDRKYERFGEILLAYVWNVTDLSRTTMCLTYPAAVAVADEMGWTTTASWENGKYSTANPSDRLRALLAPFEMRPGSWRAHLGLNPISTQPLVAT